MRMSPPPRGARQNVRLRQGRKTPWDEWPSERPIDDIDEKGSETTSHAGTHADASPFEFEGIKATLDRLELPTGGKLTNAAAVLFCPSRGISASKEGILANRARTRKFSTLVRSKAPSSTLSTRRALHPSIIRGDVS